MMKNMIEWKKSIIASEEIKAMPIMTYPGLNILGKTVLDIITDGEVQYKCLKVLSDRYPSVASATLMMALYVEAEAFGSEITYCQDEIPTVSDRLVFGNIDPVSVIKNGTPETIRIKTLELLNRIASYKNFVLSSGCDMPPGTKLENIDALFNALDEYNEDQLKSINIYKNYYWESSELLEREVLCWDNNLSVA